ncbi:MAG: hypothetical protein KBT77_06575 [Thalassolituus oleivorans]|uniref:hypothetical protein n=1 Tax=Thalassolituus oleivorans TaxID=187493 RepID=UPI001B72BD4C|nr:hypothetical protein [Thalassolituus oleivorans]MBQ0726998.1 hypothetical protein [Thalassolituus oleivorans]
MKDVKTEFLALFSREFQNEKFSSKSSTDGSTKLSTKTLVFWARWWLDDNGGSIEGDLHLYAKKIKIQPTAARKALDELASIGLVSKRCSSFGSGRDKNIYEIDRNELNDWADSTPKHVINFLRDLLMSTSFGSNGRDSASRNDRSRQGQILDRIQSLSITKRVLLSVMFVNSDKSGYVLGLSLKDMGVMSGIPYQSTQKYVSELAGNGFIRRCPGVSGCGALGRMRSIYQVNFSVLGLKESAWKREWDWFSSFPTRNHALRNAEDGALGGSFSFDNRITIEDDTTIGRLREISSHVFRSAFFNCKSRIQVNLLKMHFFRYQTLITVLACRLLKEHVEFRKEESLSYEKIFQIIKRLMIDLSMIIPDISDKLIEQNLPPLSIPLNSNSDNPESFTKGELISRFKELWSEDLAVSELLSGDFSSSDQMNESLAPLYKASVSITIALNALNMAMNIGYFTTLENEQEHRFNPESAKVPDLWTIYLHDEMTLHLATYTKMSDKDKK